MLEVVFIYVQDDGSPVSIFVSDPNRDLEEISSQ